MHDSPNLTIGVRITLRHSEWRRAVVRLVLVIAALCTACVAPADAASRNAARAKQRAALLRAVKANPRVATKPGFLRKAALFGVDVPITVRLNGPIDQAGTPSGSTDDQIQLLLDDPPSDPALPAGVSPGVVTSNLDGGWTGTLRFSADTSGYGAIGVVELGFRQIKMTGTGFDLIDAADPTPCVGGPALLKTAPTIAINTGMQSQGYLNILQNTFDIALRTQFAFTSQRRDDCTSNVFTTTSLMDGNFRPPIPIRISGTFRISPALTPDGQVRFGRLALKGVQADSHIELHTCTDAPPPAACPPDSKLTGRVIAYALTADVLIGTVPL